MDQVKNLDDKRVLYLSLATMKSGTGGQTYEVKTQNTNQYR